VSAAVPTLSPAEVEAGLGRLESLAALDRSDPLAVDAYNARVKEREERIGAYESRVSTYNGRVDGIRTNREAFARSCGNRRYDTRDLDDLNRTRKK